MKKQQVLVGTFQVRLGTFQRLLKGFLYVCLHHLGVGK